ncbi:hypothetical protein JIN85_19435 [Luteolibacter pohnpeiensis]|uniref:Uncharacterized protein n=1 Tax=Luteolibacter pohnpeiensis TaxID=454153 RepID=A0A934SG67_9BACT|nr:hypothetical protein [Luteolibacter pohnpeiensis]MBK1884598.1 hypothetical protein [Luteolibacter pohnpeiensis]
MHPLVIRSVIGFALFGFTSATLSGQTWEWTGSAGNAWSEGLNWDAGVPVGGSETILWFDQVPAPEIIHNIAGGLVLNQLNFTENSGPLR